MPQQPESTSLTSKPAHFSTATVGAGNASIRWNGRDRRGNLIYGGRYVLRVRAQNQYGPTELTQTFLAHR